MAGYSDFLRKRQTQAQSFLSSGGLNYNPLPVAGSNVTGCQDSTGCASGWACVGGICVKEDPDSSAGGSGNLSGCGSGGADGALPGLCGAGTDSYLTLDKSLAKIDAEARKNLKVGDVLVLQGINGGSVGDGQVGLSLNGKCLKTGCSGTSTPLGTNDVCCGNSRCCRLGSVVQCFCGECPPPPQNCSQFCTSYKASNGSSGEGCNDENTCDECAFCTDLGNFAGTTCLPKGGSGPCWCGSGIGRNCTSCEECGSDGTCEFVRENCYPTPIPPVPAPDPIDNSVPGDPCAGLCVTVPVCGVGDDPICPPQNSCRITGTITNGIGQTCKLFEFCDKSNIPDSCGFCDCSCDGSCPDCQICNESTGKCAPDPACCPDTNKVRGATKSDPCGPQEEFVGSNCEASPIVKVALPGDDPCATFAGWGWFEAGSVTITQIGTQNLPNGSTTNVYRITGSRLNPLGQGYFENVSLGGILGLESPTEVGSSTIVLAGSNCSACEFGFDYETCSCASS